MASRSIRWRLQWWHGAVLGLTLLGFGIMMYWSAKNAWFHEQDALIEAQIQYLDVHLRRLPGWALMGEERPPPPPERPPPPEQKGDRPFNKKDRPPPSMKGDRSSEKGDPNEKKGDRGLEKKDRSFEKDRSRPAGTGSRGPDISPAAAERLLKELDLPQDSEPPPGFPPPDPPFFEIRRWDDSVIKSRGMPEDFSAYFEDREPKDDPVLYFQHPYRIGVMTGPGRTTILVGRSVVSIENRLGSFARQLWFFGAVAMVLGLSGGWIIVSGIIRPIERISQNITNIRATDLSRRILIPELDLELVGLAENLNEMLERFEESFRIQARFSADASHEMRTPLAAIRSQCEMALRKPRGIEEYREALAASLRGVERLEKLVEDLLALARSEGGPGNSPSQTVDLQPILDEVIHEHRDLAAAKRITIDAELVPLAVRGDGPQLEIALGNLIRNAIVHNRDGGSVQVTMEKRDKQAVIAIRDTGYGMAPDKLKRLGERFFRADESRSTGGYGLGLAICKTIIQAHRGTIECDSEPDKGTVFRVLLTLATTGSGAAITAPGAAPPPAMG